MACSDLPALASKLGFIIVWCRVSARSDSVQVYGVGLRKAQDSDDLPSVTPKP